MSDPWPTWVDDAARAALAKKHTALTDSMSDILEAAWPRHQLNPEEVRRFRDLRWAVEVLDYSVREFSPRAHVGGVKPKASPSPVTGMGVDPSESSL